MPTYTIEFNVGFLIEADSEQEALELAWEEMSEAAYTDLQQTAQVVAVSDTDQYN